MAPRTPTDQQHTKQLRRRRNLPHVPLASGSESGQQGPGGEDPRRGRLGWRAVQDEVAGPQDTADVWPAEDDLAGPDDPGSATPDPDDGGPATPGHAERDRAEPTEA